MSALRALAVLLLGLATAAPAAAGAPAAEAKAADAILERYLAAVGGRSALERVQSSRTRSVMTFGWLKFNVETSQELPDRFVERATLPVTGAGSTSGYDGKVAWLEEAGKDRPRILSGREREQYILSHRLDRLRNLGALYAERKVLPDAEANGKPVRVVLLRTASGIEEKWLLDARTGLLAGVESRTGPDAGAATLQTYFDDYRAVAGLQVPFRIFGNNGKDDYEIRIASVEFNVPVKIVPPRSVRR